MNKLNFEKNHKKNREGKQTCRETLQQSIVFHEEIYSCKSTVDKNNFEKNHNKKKIMWGNTVAIHSVFKKKTRS